MFSVLVNLIRETTPQFQPATYSAAEEKRVKDYAVKILLERAKENGADKLQNKAKKLTAYLSPQLRELKKNPSLAEGVNNLIQKLWPLSSSCLENVNIMGPSSQAILLQELHSRRAIFLLAEFREKIGPANFENLLREAFFLGTENLPSFLQENKKLFALLAQSGEKDLFVLYLRLLFQTKTDTDGSLLTLNDPKFFLLLIETNSSCLIWKITDLFTDYQKEELINFIGNQGSLLHYAAQTGDADTVKAIRNLWGSDQEKLIQALQPNLNGDTPLHIACLNPHPGVAFFIWELYKTDQQKEIALQANNQGSTPFHLAAQTNALDVLIPFCALKGVYQKLWLVRDVHGLCILETAVLHRCSAVDRLAKLHEDELFVQTLRDLNPSGFSLLHLAVLSRSVNMLTTVWQILKSPPIQYTALLPDKMQRTPFHWAALKSNYEMFITIYWYAISLLELQVLFSSDSTAATPLDLAVEGGELRNVQHICALETNKEIYFANRIKQRVLEKALQGTHSEITRYLADWMGIETPGLLQTCYPALEDKISIEQKLAVLPFLEPSAICAFLENTELTDAQAASAIQPRINGRSPLLIITGRGNARAVSLFWKLYKTEEARHKVLDVEDDEISLSIGASANLLMNAAASGNIDTLRTVLGFYTNSALWSKVLQPNVKGDTPLHAAALSGDLETIQAMIEVYEAENLLGLFRNPTGAQNTILHAAVFSGKIETVRFIIDFCRDRGLFSIVLQPNAQGYTPLHLAVDKDIAIFDLILANLPADVSASVVDRSLFAYAVHTGTLVCVQKIWGLAANDQREKWLQPDERGMTLFHAAAMNKNSVVAQFVWGCYPDDKKHIALQPCHDLKTPLYYAANNSNQDTICFIEQCYSFSRLLAVKALYGLDNNQLEGLIANEKTKEGTRIVAKSLIFMNEENEFKNIWADVQTKPEMFCWLHEILCNDFNLTYNLFRNELIAPVHVQKVLSSGQLNEPEQKLLYLSFYAPDDILAFIKAIPRERKEYWKSKGLPQTQQVSFKDRIGSLRREFANKISWDALDKNEESYECFEELQEELKPFPSWILAFLIEDEDLSIKNHVLHCFQALTLEQLAGVVPVLDDQSFTTALLECKKTNQKLDILSKATFLQKTNFIAYSEKPWIDLAFVTLQKLIDKTIKRTIGSQQITIQVRAKKMEIEAFQAILARLIAIFYEQDFSTAREEWLNKSRALETKKIDLDLHLANNKWNDNIPSRYLCQIGQDIMKNPVKLPLSGAICDLASVENWKKSCEGGKLWDPFTRGEFSLEQVIPQDDLKAEIEEWSAKKRKREEETDGSPSNKKFKKNEDN